MKRIARLALLLAVLSLLGWGIVRERHEVRPLDEATPAASLNAVSFVEGATRDAFMLKNGLLYDANSLSPSAANEKDCKT